MKAKWNACRSNIKKIVREGPEKSGSGRVRRANIFAAPHVPTLNATNKVRNKFHHVFHSMHFSVLCKEFYYLKGNGKTMHKRSN